MLGNLTVQYTNNTEQGKGNGRWTMSKADPAGLAGRSLVQVAMTSTDLERTKRFYGDVLGLKLLFEVSGMVFFQLEGMRLMLGLDRDGKHSAGGSVLYFDAPDMDAVGAALEAKGVKFLSA